MLYKNVKTIYLRRNELIQCLNGMFVGRVQVDFNAKLMDVFSIHLWNFNAFRIYIRMYIGFLFYVRYFFYCVYNV